MDIIVQDNGNTLILVIQNFGSWPQSAIFPFASSKSGGLMSKTQAETLARVAAGVVPGPWTDWSDLGFFDGFFSAFAPFGVARSRVQGDQVFFSGLIGVPSGGTGGNWHITNLPVGQQPSAARILSTSWQAGPGTPETSTAISIGIDDAAGTLTGTPGAVVLGNDVPTGLAVVLLDGLNFAL